MPRPRVAGDRRLRVTASRGAESWRTVHLPRVVQLNVSASRHEAPQGMVRQARNDSHAVSTDVAAGYD
jgi:hypothetical protein